MAIPAEELSKNLQALDKSIKFANQMKNDYDIIKEAYSKLKQEHAEMSTALSEAKAECELAYQAKSAIERECEQLYKQWNSQLKAQADNFSEIQAQMVPSRELEMLRIQMTQELELPHRQRIEALSEEINKFRDMYFKEHRALALLSTQHEQTQAGHSRLVADMQERHRQEMEELADKNKKLQQLVEDSSVADRLRSQERENAELHLRHKQLLQENTTIRSERDSLQVALEEKALHTQTLLKQEEGKFAVLDKEREAYVTRYGEAVATLELVKADKLSVSEECTQLASQLRHVQAQLDRKTRELLYFQEASEAAAQDRSAETAAQIGRMQAALEEAKAQVSAVLLERDAMQHAAATESREVEAKMKQMREEESKKLQEADARNRQLQQLLDEAEKEFVRVHNAAREESSGLHLQHQADQAALADTTHERDQLASKVAAAQQAAQAAAADSRSRNTEFEDMCTEYEALQEKYREVVQRESGRQQNEDRLTQTLTQTQQELKAATDALEDLQDERVRDLKTAQRAWGEERDVLHTHVQQLQTELGSAQSSGRAAASKLKRDKNKYKKMASHLQAKLAAVMNELGEVKRHNDSAVTAKAAECVKLHQQLSEMERQRDTVRQRLNDKLAAQLGHSGASTLPYTHSSSSVFGGGGRSGLADLSNLL
mmetsp:Transcript_37158/g.72986  ORF Transcript_37158/g.72986 Transcript_37158/m.72986 type:complete len:661 (+) Transcript_37158:58-2040(+)